MRFLGHTFHRSLCTRAPGADTLGGCSYRPQSRLVVPGKDYVIVTFLVIIAASHLWLASVSVTEKNELLPALPGVWDEPGLYTRMWLWFYKTKEKSCFICNGVVLSATRCSTDAATTVLTFPGHFQITSSHSKFVLFVLFAHHRHMFWCIRRFEDMWKVPWWEMTGNTNVNV